MATQKDVAKKAGVSFITVSRVINNEGNVKEATRKKVEDAIRELCYFPSFAGKALNSGRNNTIGIMTPIRFNEGIENTYLMSLLKGIERACRENGQDILLSPMVEDSGSFDYLRPYRQRKVDGLIYVGLQSLSGSMIDEINDLLIPCIVIADRPGHKRISWIDTDNERAGYETTKQIWKRGHRVIAFHGLEPAIHNANIADREAGFRRAFRELAGTEPDERLFIRSGYDGESIRKSIHALFNPACRYRGTPEPTAVFCSTDNRAIAVMQELASLGLTVPGDVSIVGFDGFARFYHSSPTIATNAQPLPEMGELAVRILLEHIANRNLPRREVVMTVPFVDGESLGNLGTPGGRA
ncbi:MAG TPA: LacI family DNA-binding transcriptional regulator [Treponemataceae bacterium]|nr:LacI family DNA-binding transcriptional regulator [Treponemataceae bacterium]